MNFNIDYFLHVFPAIIPYVPVTLYLAMVSMFFAIILGMMIALVRMAKWPIIDQLMALYISLFRGIPSVVLLFIIYYGLPQLFPVLTKIGAITATILCFSLKFAAYLAEIFRAGLQSVDHGQREAGLTVGLSISQIYYRIILPQAFINALPSTGNTFISLLKDSSIAFFVGVSELLAAGKLLTTESYRFFETYLAVGLVYWAMVAVYARLQKQLEKQLTIPYKR